MPENDNDCRILDERNLELMQLGFADLDQQAKQTERRRGVNHRRSVACPTTLGPFEGLARSSKLGAARGGRVAPPPTTLHQEADSAVGWAAVAGAQPAVPAGWARSPAPPCAAGRRGPGGEFPGQPPAPTAQSVRRARLPIGPARTAEDVRTLSKRPSIPNPPLANSLRLGSGNFEAPGHVSWK